MPDMDASNQIAVIGMACRFPGASNLDEFWKLLAEGREGITHFSDEELLEAGVPREFLNDPDYVRAYGLIDDIDRFDAPFFSYTPREAQTMDPQQRLFLELCWHAFEHAGYDVGALDVPVGVFAGRGTNTYRLKNLNSHSGLFGKSELLQSLVGNDADYLSTRVAYKLNLRGPALSVQTACSTSLVAAHYACQSLLNGECDLALAGGISIDQLERKGYFYFEGGTHSADGHTRTFDAGGTGMVPANGAGVVLLKPLEDALADGDTVYAVILGSAVNNDGEDKIGFTAPSVTGQARAIIEAQSVSGVHPEEVSYIEAHGTATPLGDPIELEALGQSFGLKSRQKGYCAIGSVKSNIGHTISAAGVAGLIKTALSLHHRQIPPSLYFSQPNPQIDFGNSPFYVNDRLQDWESTGSPRIAGVSSFGIGGTNAHMLVMEAPPRPAAEDRPASTLQLLPISHRDPDGAARAGKQLADFLAAGPDVALEDVAYTLQKGRHAQGYRTFAIAAGREEAAEKLQKLPSAQKASGERPLAFLFPGQGSQHIHMGWDLFETEPVFREILKKGAQALETVLGEDILQTIYPQGDEEEAVEKLGCPRFAHPSIYMLSFALAKTLEQYGLAPAAILGHSLGEYAAATLAGVFQYEDAIRLVTRRAIWMETTEPGGMLALQMPESEVRDILPEGIDLALVNGPQDVVVSGPQDAVRQFAAQLRADEKPFSEMDVSHAFHSSLMAPIMEKYEEAVSEVPLGAPAVPFISNMSGDWIDPERAVDPAYWAGHMRFTARYSDGMDRLLAEEFILLESGPSTVLTSLARRRKAPFAYPAMRRPRQKMSDRAALLQAVGQVWSAGAPVDWNGLHTGRAPRRLPLPQYPFARNRYWIEEKKYRGYEPAAPVKRPNTDDWLYTPSWKRTPMRMMPDLSAEKENWLVFAHPKGIGSRLIEHLKSLKQQVTTVHPGAAFSPGSQHYEVDPSNRADFEYVFENTGGSFSTIVYAWDFEDVEASFFSLVHLTQAIGSYAPNRAIRLAVLTTDLYDVTGGEQLRPGQSLTLGPLRVIPYEQENVSTIGIDLSAGDAAQAGDDLLRELTADILDAGRLDHGKRVVAYRGGVRWQQTFEPVHMRREKNVPGIRKNGTYLITGGFGGIGLVLARHLTELNGANIAIVSRSAVPKRSDWRVWLESHPEDDPVSAKIAALQALELAGAKTRAFSADVTVRNAMAGVLKDIERLYGPVHGVIHSAGVAGGGMIQLKSREEAAAVLRPKVQGTLVLGELLQDISLDFFVLCSSMMSVFGDFGQVDYTAANAFMDAYAAWNTQRGQKTVSVNWDFWQEVGMAVETEVPESMRPQREAELHMGMTNAEAKRVFNRILESDLPQILVSTRDMDLRMKPPPEPGDEQTIIEEEVQATSPVEHSRRDLTTEFVAPRTEMEQKIAGIWQQLFGHDQIGVLDDFFELGGHSLMAIRMFAQVKEQTGKKLPLTSLYDFPTVEKLAERLSREEKEVWPTVVDMQPEGSAPPFFCVHGFGGGVLGYTDLARLLGEDQPFFGLRARGMDGVEDPHQEIEEMATYYVDALRKVQPKGPYYLGGYCFGGVVAFEMAKQLQSEGEETPLVAIFEGYAPIEDSEKIKWWHPRAILNFTQNATFWFKDFMKMGFRPMMSRLWWMLRTRSAGLLKRGAPPSEDVHLEDIIEDVSGIPQEHQRLMEIHIRALTRYRPHPSEGRADLFRVRGQSLFGTHEKDNGWGNLAKGGVNIHFIEGAHRNILEQPHVESLAVELRTALENAQKENGKSHGS